MVLSDSFSNPLIGFEPLTLSRRKEILPSCLFVGPEIAFLEHEGRKRVCACSPSVARIFSGFTNTTILQHCKLLFLLRAMRYGGQVGGFLPAFSSSVALAKEESFYPPSPSAVAKAMVDEWLWRTSLSMGLFLSLSVSRFEIDFRARRFRRR